MTLHYPQLTTGSVAQYGIERENVGRTALNQAPDGTRFFYGDTGAASVGWKLRYFHLTTSEFAAIQALFDACQGQTGTFTFHDPTDNLLAWSEDYSDAVWVADPLLQFSAAVADPFGGSGASRVTNAGQATQTLSQQITGPSSSNYSFALYARSDQKCSIGLFRAGAAETVVTNVSLTSSWLRFSQNAPLASQEDQIKFGIQLPPGCTISVFGFQVEPQSNSGPYKKTYDRAGVYPNSRFASDALELVSTAPDQNSCEVQIISLVGG